MAKEGYNNPRITTVAYLTSTRTQSAVEQAFGRAARIHSKCPKMAANIIAPKDPDMRLIVEKLEKEQLEAINETKAEKGEGSEQTDTRSTFVPVSAVATDSTTISNGIIIPPEMLEKADDYKRQTQDPIYLTISTPMLAKIMMDHDIQPSLDPFQTQLFQRNSATKTPKRSAGNQQTHKQGCISHR